MPKGNKWICIEIYDEGEKTNRYHVKSKKDDSILGIIKWYGPWRQYVFYPGIGTIFNPDCMDRISEFIRGEMKARKG